MLPVQSTDKFKGDHVSIRMFGAVGDGTTDDTTAVQAALTYAADNNLPLFAPKGTYLLSAGLTCDKSITIFGEGWGSCFKFKGGVTRTSGETGGADDEVFLFDSGGVAGMRVFLRDFQVDGNEGGLLNRGLIQLLDVQWFKLTSLWVHHGGVPDEDAPSGVDGISIASNNESSVIGKGIVERCLLEYTTKAGLNWSANTFDGAVTKNTVRYCSGNDYTPGIQVQDGGGVAVTGNVVYSCQGAGIFVASGAYNKVPARNTRVIDNHVYSNGQGTTDGHGIWVVNGQSGTNRDGHVIVSNNCVHDNGQATSGNAYGIYVQNVSNVSITDNIVYKNGHGGIGVANSFLEATVTYLTKHIKVNDNHVYNNSQVTAGTWHGITILGARDVEIQNNLCYDDQGTKTQGWGIYVTATDLTNPTSDVRCVDNRAWDNRDGRVFFSSDVVDGCYAGVDDVGLHIATAGGSGSAGDWHVYTHPDTGDEDGDLIIHDDINNRHVVRIQTGSPADALNISATEVLMQNETLRVKRTDTSDAVMHLQTNVDDVSWYLSQSTRKLLLFNHTAATTPVSIDLSAVSNALLINSSSEILGKVAQLQSYGVSSSTPTSGMGLIFNGTLWAPGVIFPSQTGNANKVLKTDGTSVSWWAPSGTGFAKTSSGVFDSASAKVRLDDGNDVSMTAKNAGHVAVIGAGGNTIDEVSDATLVARLENDITTALLASSTFLSGMQSALQGGMATYVKSVLTVTVNDAGGHGHTFTAPDTVDAVGDHAHTTTIS